jgi:6-phosphofructokinase
MRGFSLLPAGWRARPCQDCAASSAFPARPATRSFDRYQQCGVQGLTDRSRRPYRYAHQLPFQVENYILNVKQEHPSWGARKIRERLLRRFTDIKLPAKSTIHAVLDRHGLVERRSSRSRPRAQGTALSLRRAPLRLHQAGIHVVTLSKTIDNDVAMTDATFGYATALDIATEAIDRLHSTAHSHHRIIVAESMGHRAGWLTLGAGLAGGADVVLIPEILYDVEKIVKAIRRRSKQGKNFSIVAVAEGAMSRDEARIYDRARKILERTTDLNDKIEAKREIAALDVRHQGNTMRLARQLEELTHLESRVTILGYVQRGGTPCAADRILATRLGTACADLIKEGKFGVMVAARGDGTEPVPLDKVAGKRKSVPLDHSWIETARRLETCLGD